MSDAFVPQAGPTSTLTGDAVGGYTRWAVRALRAARLNNQYPDARSLGAHIGAMGPDVHGGLYDSLEINLRAGLPTYTEWTRVQTDATVATQVLADLPPADSLRARAAAEPGGIHARQLAKHGYYGALRDQSLATLGDMHVTLRRVEPESNTAHFHVVLDKLDVSGVFVRYSIDLAQTAGAWNRPVVHLEAEHARHTEEFRTSIYRFTSMDAEFTLVKLAALGGIAVERVVKGVVGPFFVSPEHAPAPMRHVLEHAPDAMIASFSVDTAATDIAEDRNNDPLGSLLLSQLSDEARQGYELARAQYRYRVYKDRKFVAPRGLHAALREVCESVGTRNIIYAV